MIPMAFSRILRVFVFVLQSLFRARVWSELRTVKADAGDFELFSGMRGHGRMGIA